MANQESESGLELVVDNRKLIIAFALLILICVGFFVLGFREGKRQGLQEGSQLASESQPNKGTAVIPVPAGEPARVEPAAASAKQPADQQLDWYKNVSRREGETEPIPSAVPPETKPNAAVLTPAAAPPDQSKTDAKQPVVYSVQVGAFLQKQELELRAKMLREKGFECRTEPPEAPGGFYLLKVGKFQSRAEAAAVKLRLQKSGFPSFIKTK